MNSIKGEAGALDGALDRARRWSPFLAHLIEREPAVAAALPELLHDPLAGVRIDDEDMPVARRLRIERRRG